MSKNQFVSEYGELSNEILLNIAEILAIRLPEGSERIIASKWVKKFNKCDPKSYRHYLTLFVSCLTKQLLVEPFDILPTDTSSQWQDFEKEYSQANINNAVIQRLYKDSLTPPYQFDMSSDMKEYVVFQEIPFFGAHFYYAFSPRDRIDKWNGFNKMNVPKSLVDMLRKDDQVESPIKGRMFPRPQFASRDGQRDVSIRATSAKAEKSIKLKKPQWEDLIPQDEEVELEPEKKPIIVLPTDVAPKNIPVALQRRMAKAEQERQERLAKKAQENKERLNKSAMPKKLASLRRPTVSKPSLKKEAKGKKSVGGIAVDDIDAALLAKKPDTPKPPKSPEFKGPHADLQRRLVQLRQSNVPPSELIKTTHDISQVSADINREAVRLQRDGKARSENVERLQNTSLSVGNRILNMLREHQANGIHDVANNAAGAINNVRLTMEQLDEMLEDGAPTHDDALKRLNEIKEKMQQSAKKAQSVSVQMNGMKIGNELMDMMDNMVQVNENSANELQGIQIETQQEGILIDGLEDSSQRAAEAIQEQRDRLARALENNEPALLAILDETVKNIDEILALSMDENTQLSENVEVTRNAQMAMEIDAEKNEQLIDMNERAMNILQEVETAIAKVMDVDQSDDLIDIDNQDLEFDDILDDDELERQLQMKSQQQQNRSIEMREKLLRVMASADENLEDISSSLIDEIENSMSEVDDVLIPGLQKLEDRASSQKERDMIRDVIQILEVESELLNKSLIDMINLREAVAEEKENVAGGGLEEDLIQFD